MIVNNIASKLEPHGPTGSLVVNVNVTVPAVISAPDGVYTAVLLPVLLNEPVPLDDQVPLEAPPP